MACPSPDGEGDPGRLVNKLKQAPFATFLYPIISMTIWRTSALLKPLGGFCFNRLGSSIFLHAPSLERFCFDVTNVLISSFVLR